MAPEKNQVAKPPACHTDSVNAQKKETHFLDLGDDVFGKIYACLDESEDKRAVRHSCATLYRSPAVNAHISEVWNGRKNSGSAEDIWKYLAAFPPHANLKAVNFVGGKRNLESVTECALCSTPVNKIARERCQNVNIVRLEDFVIPRGSDAAILTLLFPEMRGAAGNTQLGLKRCSLHPNFLSVFSTQAQLKVLGLIDCEFVGGINGLMPVLGGFSSLTSLYLHLPRPSSVALQWEHLCELQELQFLSLRNIFLVGFDGLLPKLSSLQQLYLSEAHFPAGVRLASNTLRELFWGILHPTFPELAVDSFPALQRVDFAMLDLGVGIDGLNDVQKVRQVKQMVTWLAKSPLQLGDIGEDADAVDTFGLSNAVDGIRGKPGWSGELCDLMLGALLPLKAAYASLPHLFRVIDWQFPQLSSMSTLCSLLPSIVGISFTSCKFGNEVCKRGFMDFIKQLPRLRYLEAEVDRPPRDTLATLAVAQQAGRSFDLVLSTRAPTCHARVLEMVEEWKVLKEGLSTGLQEDGMVRLIAVRT